MTSAKEQALKAYPNIKIGEQRLDQSSASEDFEAEWKRYCDSKGGGVVTMNIKDVAKHFAKFGYEQALKDMKETFEKMSKNTNIAIDAVKALGSLLDNPDIRKKLGKSKPIPKKPIKTNPFFGGEKK